MIAIENSSLADFKLSTLNGAGKVPIADNGIRCAARYIYMQQLVPSTVKKFTIETDTQQLQVELIGKGDRIRINMGVPTFDGHLIPTAALGEQLNKTINIDGTSHQISAVGMVEAHCVLFLTGIDYLDLKNLGSRIENHVYFPNGCMVDFAEVLNSELIKLRLWEKGKEVVVAAGRASCAVAAAAMRLNYTARRVVIRTIGGEFEVLWNDNESSIYITGGADSIFCGEIDIEKLLGNKIESPLN